MCYIQLFTYDVEVGGTVEWNGVAFEEVGHDDEVPIGCEVVGEATNFTISTPHPSYVGVVQRRTAEH